MQRKYNSYTPEQLKRSLELYQEGRQPDKNSRGKYTLMQIQAMTGVHYCRVFSHANPMGSRYNDGESHE